MGVCKGVPDSIMPAPPPEPPHRIKMGVCEGVPGSIMPDHMGRADYHGASVNQAARFMDAGERGGGGGLGATVTGPALARRPGSWMQVMIF